MREIHDGWVASSTLKATKKSVSNNANGINPSPKSHSPICTIASSTMAALNTGLSLSRRSATITAGTMTTKDSSTAGR